MDDIRLKVVLAAVLRFVALQDRSLAIQVARVLCEQYDVDPQWIEAAVEDGSTPMDVFRT